MSDHMAPFPCGCPRCTQVSAAQSDRIHALEALNAEMLEVLESIANTVETSNRLYVLPGHKLEAARVAIRKARGTRVLDTAIEALGRAAKAGKR